MKKWHTKKIGSWLGSQVYDEDGLLIAAMIQDDGVARLITQLPELKELRYEWASIINRLACLALDGADSNGRDYAQDMIDKVLPYLDGEFCGFEEEIA